MDHASASFDHQLHNCVKSRAPEDLASLHALLPLCSTEGRKNALKGMVTVESEEAVVAVAAYCVRRNELTTSEINTLALLAVTSSTHRLVELVAPLLSKDPHLLNICILLKNPRSAHALIDVFGFDAESFELAAQMGLDSVVARLLPLGDPKHNNSQALYQAVRCNHQTCVDLLYEESDRKTVVERLNTDFPHHSTPVWEDFKTRVERDVLRSQIGGGGALSSRKM